MSYIVLLQQYNVGILEAQWAEKHTVHITWWVGI